MCAFWMSLRFTMYLLPSIPNRSWQYFLHQCVEYLIWWLRYIILLALIVGTNTKEWWKEIQYKWIITIRIIIVIMIFSFYDIFIISTMDSSLDFAPHISCRPIDFLLFSLGNRKIITIVLCLTCLEVRFIDGTTGKRWFKIRNVFYKLWDDVGTQLHIQW